MSSTAYSLLFWELDGTRLKEKKKKSLKHDSGPVKEDITA